MKSRDKRKKHWWSLSSSFQADGSLKTPTSESSSSSLLSNTGRSVSDKHKPHTCRDREKLNVIHAVSHCFKKTDDCHTYRLVDTSTKYDRTVLKYIAKMAKRTTALMEPHTFKPLRPILIIWFLKVLTFASDTNGVYKGAAMRMFHVFMKETASAVLNAFLCADGTCKKHSWSANCKARYFTTYLHAVVFLQKKCATDEAIAKTESEITSFAQPSHMTLSHFVEDLMKKHFGVKTRMRNKL